MIIHTPFSPVWYQTVSKAIGCPVGVLSTKIDRWVSLGYSLQQMKELLSLTAKANGRSLQFVSKFGDN